MNANTSNTTGKQNSGQDGAPAESALMDVEQVAAMLRCSTRHIYRLADASKIPRPFKLGTLSRWDRSTIESWIAEGCPSCRTIKQRR